jgi:hypothetical protein
MRRPPESTLSDTARIAQKQPIGFRELMNTTVCRCAIVPFAGARLPNRASDTEPSRTVAAFRLVEG